MIHRARLLVALIVCAGAVLSLSAHQPDDRAGVVAKFLAESTVPHSYRAHRRIEAGGAGLNAWVEADTEFAPATGLQYQITDQGGAGIIRSKVLLPMLEEEQRLIARGATATVAITPANYELTEGSAEGGMARILLQPRREERTLIDGELFVNADDGAPVRLDGKLARNPSFWTKRVDVVRLYERVNDVVMPVSLQSTAQLRLFGRSTLRMTYHYTAIDDRPVAVPSTR